MERYLVAIDFDETVAHTFEQSPNGVGVKKAYDNAIKNIFGDEGMQIYVDKLGGLQNRSPSHLVDLILRESINSHLELSASQFFEENISRLLSLMPPSRIKERLCKREIDNEIITELVIIEKLSYLFNEVGNNLQDGQIWPRLCNGFDCFYQTIEDINTEEEDIVIDIAIVSSGHDEFIKKTFLTHDLKPPEIIITDDTIRGKKYPALEKRVKPKPYPFALAHREWLRDQNICSKHSRKNIVYIGDDPNKDGSLAKNCDVLFGLFDPRSHCKLELSENRFSFSDWRELADTLQKNKQLLSQGEQLSNIFSVRYEKK